MMFNDESQEFFKKLRRADLPNVFQLESLISVYSHGSAVESIGVTSLKKIAI